MSKEHKYSNMATYWNECDLQITADSASSGSAYTVPSHRGPSRTLAAKKSVRLVSRGIQAGQWWSVWSHFVHFLCFGLWCWKTFTKKDPHSVPKSLLKEYLKISLWMVSHWVDLSACMSCTILKKHNTDLVKTEFWRAPSRSCFLSPQVTWSLSEMGLDITPEMSGPRSLRLLKPDLHRPA